MNSKQFPHFNLSIKPGDDTVSILFYRQGLRGRKGGSIVQRGIPILAVLGQRDICVTVEVTEQNLFRISK